MTILVSLVLRVYLFRTVEIKKWTETELSLKNISICVCVVLFWYHYLASWLNPRNALHIKLHMIFRFESKPGISFNIEKFRPFRSNNGILISFTYKVIYYIYAWQSPKNSHVYPNFKLIVLSSLWIEVGMLSHMTYNSCLRECRL